jgi:hypothetical protein
MGMGAVTQDEKRIVLLRESHDLMVRSWIQEVAHIRKRNHDARVEMRVSLLVVVLSTIVGGTVFASLATDPNQAVKIGVGIMSVAAAVAAAVNEWAPFAGRSKAHGAAAFGFSNVTEKARRLHRRLELDQLTSDEAESELETVTDEYQAQEEVAPADSYYAEAEIWVHHQLQEADGRQVLLPRAEAHSSQSRKR